MNITGITNHMKFDKIFSEARVNGKISWLVISMMDGLPQAFIDQYFKMLKPFCIERTQKMNDWLIEKHADSLNWFMLLKHQDVSEDVLKKNIRRLDKLQLWSLLLKTQKLSLEFMVDNIDRIKRSRNPIDALDMNTSIEESVKAKVKSLISAE